VSGREAAIAAFLAAAGWSEAAATALGADWSSRRYLRLRRETGTAILMDAAADQPVGPFVRVACWLRSIGLHAPAILAADESAGLLLLEDLGDELLARAPMAGGGEAALYALAVEALLHMQAAEPPPWLPALDAAALVGLLDLFVAQAAPGADAVRFRAVWTELLAATPLGPARFLHRDYHAENLLVVPAATGLWRLGLLDFQDAHVGPRVYDLVSLLQDARRDVDPDVAEICRRRFSAAVGLGRDALDRQQAVLGAQRALRILGVVARLEGMGRRFPAGLADRVRRDLAINLTHPALAALRRWCETHYPQALRAG
jgi:aminoglycoside/choline kinase family phosphotransferase